MKNCVRFICLVMALSLGIGSVAFAADYSSRYGDTVLKYSKVVKRVVKNLQADLNKNTSYTLTINGVYNDKTVKAVKAFQKDKKLEVDGKTGKNTKTKLYPLRDKNVEY